MKKHIFHKEKWQWYELDFGDSKSFEELAEEYYASEEWLRNVKTSKSNNIQMDTTYQGKESVWGSLVYMQNIEKQNDRRVFHFYLTREFLLTDQLDLTIFHEEEEKIMSKLDQANSPMEGFMVIINLITNNLLQFIDEFEEKIHDLIWKLKTKNSERVLYQLIDRRHELLTSQNLLIPIREIYIGLIEAFGEDLEQTPDFKKADKRIYRTRVLVDEYEQELATLTNLETVMGSFRGNEIFKALTVITIIYTPLMAWAALWGMNFKHMPELDLKLGYLFAWILILGNTAVIYYFLRKKGWLGDLLKERS